MSSQLHGVDREGRGLVSLERVSYLLLEATSAVTFWGHRVVVVPGCRRRALLDDVASVLCGMIPEIEHIESREDRLHNFEKFLSSIDRIEALYTRCAEQVPGENVITQICSEFREGSRVMSLTNLALAKTSATLAKALLVEDLR